MSRVRVDLESVAKKHPQTILRALSEYLDRRPRQPDAPGDKRGGAQGASQSGGAQGASQTAEFYNVCELTATSVDRLI